MKPVFKLKNNPYCLLIYSFDEELHGKKVIWGTLVCVKDSVSGSFEYNQQISYYPENELEPTNLPEKEALQELLNNYRVAFPLV